MIIDKGRTEINEDVDMALPNDEEDMHKLLELRERPSGATDHMYRSQEPHEQDKLSLDSSQKQKLNRKIGSKTFLIPQSPGQNHVAFVDGKFVTLDKHSSSKDSI